MRRGITSVICLAIVLASSGCLASIIAFIILAINAIKFGREMIIER